MDGIKLTDLNPRFYRSGGEGISDSKTGNPIPERKGMGITFDCPCGECGERAAIAFANPISGGTKRESNRDTWQRTGDNFENLTLTPSIQLRGKCKWHGFLTNGYLVK